MLLHIRYRMYLRIKEYVLDLLPTNTFDFYSIIKVFIIQFLMILFDAHPHSVC